MEKSNVAFWVNGTHGEWGTVDATTAWKLSQRKGFDKRSGQQGPKGWVDSFVAAMRKDGTFLLVDDKEEFQYLYRCFETLSMPLSYCPLEPRSNKANVGREGSPSRLAA